MTTDLPELYEAQPPYGVYRRDVVEEYGIACWNAAIEAAARECEEAHTNYPRERELNRIYAKAIRALTKGTT
jgi:hypothetical protein